MRCFVGVELGGASVQGEATILRFRHLLERHRLTDAIFAEIRELTQHLLHGQEYELFGDQAYWIEDHRAHWVASGRTLSGQPAGDGDTAADVAAESASARALNAGEHAFHVVKRLWGFNMARGPVPDLSDIGTGGERPGGQRSQPAARH